VYEIGHLVGGLNLGPKTQAYIPKSEGWTSAMAQYFFTVLDGHKSSLKNEGLDLPDSEAAWVEATTACGELLRNLNGRLRPGDHWSMQVKDEAGTDLYILEFKTRSLER
jgi:hypothetical protein